MKLNQIFPAIAYKELAQVDLPEGSHQHEINGVASLREFFKTDERISKPILWYYFADDSNPQKVVDHITFYDSRKKSYERTGRSEWRLYYYDNFLRKASAGDSLILARTAENGLIGLIFQQNSAWLHSAQKLFSLDEIKHEMLVVPEEILREQEIEFYKQELLNELEVEVSFPEEIIDDDIAEEELTKANKEGRNFPSTSRMSELAQQLVGPTSEDADETIVRWLNREEEIFRAIEKILVSRKLEEGFSSVDEFISYSLSIQNRRKSRMGYALQNHLHRLFIDNRLEFETQALTEGKNKPDFLFPSRKKYFDESFDKSKLMMLAAKSSCKERWRQILTEAKRIPYKHLCTLEQAISINQTDEMETQKVRLVLPRDFHNTYSEKQRQLILTVSDFIKTVKEHQSKII